MGFNLDRYDYDLIHTYAELVVRTGMIIMIY